MIHTQEEIRAAAEESAGGLTDVHGERYEHIAGFKAGYAMATAPPLINCKHCGKREAEFMGGYCKKCWTGGNV